MLSRASRQATSLLNALGEAPVITSKSTFLNLVRLASSSSSSKDVHSTTVLCVRKDGECIVMADGQVTMGGTVVKPNVRKTRKLGDTTVGGFAGATADAFTLFERLETKLEEHPGENEKLKMFFVPPLLSVVDDCYFVCLCRSVDACSS